MKKSPLDDLSFFKFPELTSEVVQNIVLLFVVIALTILLTLVAQKYINRLNSGSRHRKTVRRIKAGSELSIGERETMDKLLALASAKKFHKLIQDSWAYETAVERLVRDTEQDEARNLGALRRAFHLNAMNPAVELVSTRQLLPDYPLRLVTGFQDERLDLYCALLEADEQFLILDLNVPDEVYSLLTAQPEGNLIFWREGEGEILFRITLEQINAEGAFPLLRARHVFRAEEEWQRADFRLSVDFPVRFSYLERETIRQASGGEEGSARAIKGEGHLMDLSFGGAAFVTDERLPPGGFAQLHFHVHEQPVRFMLEVLSNFPYGRGKVLVRGRLRGMQADGRTVLNTFLSREQVKRLREREAFHFRPGA